MAIVGRSEVDFQKLRAQRGHVADDDPNAPAPPTPVDLAGPDAPTPA